MTGNAAVAGAAILDAPHPDRGLRQAGPRAFEATVGLPDPAETAARLASIAGLRIFVARDRAITLGDPRGLRPFLRVVRRPVPSRSEAVLCRITFGVTSLGDLHCATAHAVRSGATPLRALRDDDATTVHFEGPSGIEVGFVYRSTPWVPADWLRSSPRSFAPQRLSNCTRGHDGAVWLDHLTLGRRSSSDRAGIEGAVPERLAEGVVVFRTHAGRPAAVLATRDDLRSSAALVSVS